MGPLYESEFITTRCWSDPTAMGPLYESEFITTRCWSDPTAMGPLYESEFITTRCWSDPTAMGPLATRLERLLASASASMELHDCAPHPEPHTALISAPTSSPPPTFLSYAGFSPFGVRASDCG